MDTVLQEWFQFKQEVYNVLDPEGSDLEGFDELENQYNETAAFGEQGAKATYPVSPLLFDRSVASTGKNPPYSLATQVDPYLTHDELSLRLAGSQVNLSCVGDSESTAEAIALSRFLSSTTRRELEYTGSPKEQPVEWAHYNPEDIMATVAITQYLNKDFLQQNVSRTKSPYWMEDILKPGNLTNQTLGRTAQFIMTSNWGAAPELQALLSDHRESDVYSRVATEAFDLANTSADAASNADIFLYVLAMAAASDEIFQILIPDEVPRVQTPLLWLQAINHRGGNFKPSG